MQPLANLIKLSDDLELDPRTYELRREGCSVKLERIPMEILLFLIERRPDLVTREQIAEKIWGPNTHGDIDNGINVAVRKIRLALRDDPEDPRFIRTVTGKGYRFIATPREVPAAPLVATPASNAAPGPPAHPPPETSPPALGLPTRLPEQGPLEPLESPSPQPPKGSQPGVPHDTHAGRRWWVLAAALVLVGMALAMYYLRRPAMSAPTYQGRQMLAVLPFENLTGDPGQDYFSDGFTEEMITRLGSLEPGRLGVIARSSVMYYKQSPAPLDRLARDLGVQYVLEGSVRRDSQRVRITAQLIQLKDQTHLWARQFDRDPADVLQIQEEIALAIADEIKLTLGASRASPRHTAAFSAREYEAYEHYLRGRYFWNKRTRADFQRAVESFQRAVAANPGDARGYAGLADTYALMGTWGFSPEEEVIPKARAAALKALEIDENHAGALTTLALINETIDLDGRTAEDRFRKAIELEPNYATAHQWYAELLTFEGRSEEAIAEISLARKLDPRSLIIATDQGWFLSYARQYDRAIVEFRKVLAIDPKFSRANGGLVAAYMFQGRFDEALVEIHRWMQFSDEPYPWAMAVYVHARRGELAKARETLREAEDRYRRLNMDPSGARGGMLLGLGLKEEVFASMQEDCKEHPGRLRGVKVDPLFDPLRNDPRFEQLIRCAHLEP